MKKIYHFLKTSFLLSKLNLVFLIMIFKLILILSIQQANSQFSLAAENLKQIKTGTYPSIFAINPINNKVYVGNYNSKTISIISEENDSVISTVGFGPVKKFKIDTSNNLIYALNTTGYLRSIDGQTNLLNKSYLTKVTDFDLSPDFSKIYVLYANVIYVYNASMLKLITKVSIAEKGFAAQGILINKKTNKLFAYGKGGKLKIFDSIKDEYLYKVDLKGDSPYNSIVSDDNNGKIYLYCYKAKAFNGIIGIDKNDTIFGEYQFGDWNTLKEIKFNNGKIYFTKNNVEGIYILNSSDVSYTDTILLNAGVFEFNPLKNIMAVLSPMGVGDQEAKLSIVDLTTKVSQSFNVFSAISSTQSPFSGYVNSPLAISLNPLSDKIYFSYLYNYPKQTLKSRTYSTTIGVAKLTAEISPNPQSKFSTGWLPTPKITLMSAPKAKILLPFAGAYGLPLSVDNSNTNYMPSIGNQGAVNSCTAWATTYYYKCYQEAKDNGWTLRPGYDTSKLCSPAFVYNQVNNGVNQGTTFTDAFMILSNMGVVSWDEMPYSPDPANYYSSDNIDFASLPEKEDYKNAAKNRANSYSHVCGTGETACNDTNIIQLKTLLSNGDLFVFAMNVDATFQGYNAGNCYETRTDISGGGHAMTIVGYDDNYGGGVGAFKIANSWGTAWGCSGYAWISYNSFKANAIEVWTMTDKIDYSPTIFAEIDLNHMNRGRMNISFSVGPNHIAPVWTFNYYTGSSLYYYPDPRDNYSAFIDLTEASSYYCPDSSNQMWFIKVVNNDAANSASIDKLQIEKSGRIMKSYNPPVPVAPSSTNYADITGLKITLIMPNSAQTGETVNITNLSGENFATNSMSIQLTRLGYSAITASNVVIVSDTMMTCDFDLSSAIPGEWNVKVQSPADGCSYTLPNGFSITEGLSICNVTTNADSGAGSLRTCLELASNTVGINIINFNISNQTISPNSQLPAISDTTGATIIDGIGKNITIDGSSCIDCDGFRITSANNEIKGLTIINFNSDDYAGIRITGTQATSNSITGCKLGNNGTVASENYNGIVIESGAKSNIIGGSTSDERNIISGNRSNGILIYGAGTNSNLITGNYIGLNSTGNSAIANGNGIQISDGASSNIIGGTSEGTRNIISGNTSNGIYIYGSGLTGPSDNQITGNYIGTNSSGSSAVPNSVGIFIANGAQSNTIGGIAAGEGNLITFNSGDGIYIEGANTDSNKISGNKIHSNGALGINLAGDGANNNIQPPTIATATQNGSNYDIGGTIVTCPNYPCRVELFRVDDTASGVVPDPSGYGEGFEYLSSATIAAGNNFTFTNVSISGGATITATLTDNASNSSEFGTNYSLPPLVVNNCPGWTVTTDADSGPGSLRACITETNSVAGTQTITFSISDYRILIESPLPEISDNTGGTIIDATGKNIILDGTNCTNCNGLTISSANNQINGLTIINFNSNGYAGVKISGAQATGNEITGCKLGNDGTSARANYYGVVISSGATANIIGGATEAERNIISGNIDAGVDLNGTGTNYNQIKGNYIGINASGTAALANGVGIHIYSDASSNIIGSTTVGEGNIIAYNLSDGIYLEGMGSDFNTISGNLIYSNGGLGIDLEPDGTGAGSGTNNNISPPLVSSASVTALNTYTFSGTACANCTVELFLVDKLSLSVEADSTGYGEAIEYLGSGSADGTGNWTISGATIPGATGYYITTTATDSDGNTSEFSQNYEIACISWQVMTNSNGGNGCLHACIEKANSEVGTQTINFMISDQTISPTTQLPTISDNTGGTIIDATGKNITIDGNSCANCNGFYITSSNNQLKGLTITRFNSSEYYAGIHISGASATYNIVSGCKIGNNGTTARANRYGIIIQNSASSNIIGGTTEAERNIISGNTASGIYISGTNTNSNVIKGNYIGLNSAGTAGIANSNHGIYIYNGPKYNIIGESDELGTGGANLIAYNTMDGVYVYGGNTDYNRISKNSFYSNGELGIDLYPNGVNINDTGDTDTGANQHMNYPVIDIAFFNTFTGNTLIVGRLDTPNASSTTIELYIADVSSTVNGEGKTYITTVTPLDDSPGNWEVTLSGLSVGQYITAIAIDSQGNTSEFAKNVMVDDIKLTSVEVGVMPTVAGINPVNDKVYIGNYKSGTTSIIDGTTDEVITTLKTGAIKRFKFDTTNNKVYALTTGNLLRVIDGSNNSMLAKAYLNGIADFEINSTANRLYIPFYKRLGRYSYQRGIKVYKIDYASSTSTFQFLRDVYFNSEDIFPSAVLFNPSNRKIYVWGSNNKVVILNGDVEPEIYLTTITLPTNIQTIALNTTTNNLYALCYSFKSPAFNGVAGINSSDVVFATRNLDEGLAKINSQVDKIAINTFLNKIYVGKTDYKRGIYILDGSDLTVMGPGGASPSISTKAGKFDVDSTKNYLAVVSPVEIYGSTTTIQIYNSYTDLDSVITIKDISDKAIKNYAPAIAIPENPVNFMTINKNNNKMYFAYLNEYKQPNNARTKTFSTHIIVAEMPWPPSSPAPEPPARLVKNEEEDETENLTAQVPISQPLTVTNLHTYPNPWTGSGQITFSAESATGNTPIQAILKVYDIRGKLVLNYVTPILDITTPDAWGRGIDLFSFNPQNMSGRQLRCGIYFYYLYLKDEVNQTLEFKGKIGIVR